MRRILILGTALALSLALAAPVSAEGSTVHVVQPGENLFRIALHYGVTVDALTERRQAYLYRAAAGHPNPG